MPYTPTKFATVTELNNSIINRVYQNTNNAVDGDVHQQVELDEAVSLWREPTAVLPLAYSGLLQSQQIKLTDGTATGVTLQWNGTAWVEAQARTGKTLWVDATYGDPANAQPYNPFRPYLNLDAAQTAATTGDTIYVRPGAYTTSGIGKNGVNWYFAPGAVVTGPIRDGGVAMVFAVSGFGTFTAAGNAVESTAATGTTINVKANSITSTGGSGVYQSGTNTVSVESSISGLIGANCIGGTQYIRGNCTGSSGAGVSCSGGTQTVYGTTYSASAQAAFCNGGIQTIYGKVDGTGFASNATLYIHGTCANPLNGPAGRVEVWGDVLNVGTGGNATGTLVIHGDVLGTVYSKGSVTIHGKVLGQGAADMNKVVEVASNTTILKGDVYGGIWVNLNTYAELRGIAVRRTDSGPAVTLSSSAFLILGAGTRLIANDGTNSIVQDGTPFALNYWNYGAFAKKPATVSLTAIGVSLNVVGGII